MNASPNLTFKQQRFVEEYQVDGNGSQAVLRAGYKTKHPAEIAYGLLRHPKVKHSLQSAQNARRRQLQIRAVEPVGERPEGLRLPNSTQSSNHLAKYLKIFGYYHAEPLLEAIEKDPDNLEELVDQFLWINTPPATGRMFCRLWN